MAESTESLQGGRKKWYLVPFVSLLFVDPVGSQARKQGQVVPIGLSNEDGFFGVSGQSRTGVALLEGEWGRNNRKMHV